MSADDPKVKGLPGATVPPTRLVHKCNWDMLRTCAEVAAMIFVLTEFAVAPAVIIAIWRWAL